MSEVTSTNGPFKGVIENRVQTFPYRTSTLNNSLNCLLSKGKIQCDVPKIPEINREKKPLLQAISEKYSDKFPGVVILQEFIELDKQDGIERYSVNLDYYPHEADDSDNAHRVMKENQTRKTKIRQELNEIRDTVGKILTLKDEKPPSIQIL